MPTAETTIVNSDTFETWLNQPAVATDGRLSDGRKAMQPACQSRNHFAWCGKTTVFPGRGCKVEPGGSER
jgi:hypothetical protein